MNGRSYSTMQTFTHNRNIFCVHPFLKDKKLVLVSTHDKEHRSLEFYVGKLCLTPKYLSKVIKENNGKSSNDWIDDYVVLESNVLLKSTNMTIQKIVTN